MAKVKIADILEPTTFAKYSIERTTAVSRLFQSGVIGTDPRITEAAMAGGRTANMPFWQALSGRAEIRSDGISLTPAKLGTAQDISTLHHKGKAWSANDLAATISGHEDPAAAITNMSGDFWAEELQATLNATLVGIFATELATSHKVDVATDSAATAVDAELFSDDKFNAAQFLLGDKHKSLTAIAVHSVVMERMLNLDLIDYKPPSDGAVDIPFYRGREVLVDDDVPTVTGTNRVKYYTLLFGPGAIGYGEGAPKNPVEFDRDILAGDDIMTQNRDFILHPRGVAWTGSAAGVSPTDTELETGSNWSKVYDNKNILITALVTNG